MSDDLFTERDGQVLTGDGWQPAAVVEFKRRSAQRWQTWGFSAGIVGIFLAGWVFGVLAIGLGLVGNARARAVGAKQRPGPFIVGGLAIVAQFFWIELLS